MRKLTGLLVLVSFISTIFTQNIALAFYQQSERYSLAVLNIAVKGGDITRTEARMLSGRLTEEMERGGLFFTMSQPDMERGLMLKNLDLSGCETIDCGIRAGRALGVQLIAIGSVRQNGTIYSIKLQMIHVTSREIVKSLNEVFEGDVYGLMENMPVFASKFIGQPRVESSPGPRNVEYNGADRAYNQGSNLKWYLLGIGMLVAGGVGAGLYLTQKNSNGNGTTPTVLTGLPKPPNFP